MQLTAVKAGGKYTVSTNTVKDAKGNFLIKTPTCPITSGGCVSVVAFRSSTLGGGVWFSSAWGPVVSGDLPQTVEKVIPLPTGATYIN